MKRMPVRLIDIARHLGMSKAGVSMALRGDPSIPQTTQQRVVDAARAMGYTPDPALRRLTEARWGRQPKKSALSIGLVQARKSDYPQLRTDLLPWLEKEFEALGYALETFCLKEYPNRTHFANVAYHRGVAGLLLLPSVDPDAYLDIPWEQFSGLHLLTGIETNPGLPVVRPDVFGAMLDMGRRAVSCRPARCGIILVRQKGISVTDYRWLAAARLVTEQWKEGGVEFAAIYHHDVEQPKDASLDSMKDWLNELRPDFVAGYSITILQTIRALNGLPRHHAIALRKRSHNREWAGYMYDNQLLAQSAAMQLDAMVRKGRRGLQRSVETTLIPNIWQSGASYPE